MFSAFDDRSTNIYNAVYYTRSITENDAGFIDAVFKTDVPMSAVEQKETFKAILSDSVAEGCSLQMVQTVQEQLSELLAEHKAAKIREPLAVSKQTGKDVLTSCGVSATQAAAFEARYGEAFGADKTLSPRNIVDTRQLELRLPEVTFRVSPGCGDLIETRIIDGKKYLLIRAEQGVEVNGDAHQHYGIITAGGYYSAGDAQLYHCALCACGVKPAIHYSEKTARPILNRRCPDHHTKHGLKTHRPAAKQPHAFITF